MTPDRARVTKWLLELLRADPNEYAVGDHAAPRGVLAYPYWTVWSIAGGGTGGPPLGAAQADASFVYQVDSVGMTRDQAEALGSRAKNRISGRAADGSYVAPRPSPSGMVVIDRVPHDTPGAATATGSYPNEVWTYSERFAVSVSVQT